MLKRVKALKKSSWKVKYHGKLIMTLEELKINQACK